MTLFTLLSARNALPLDVANVDIQLKYKIAKFIKSTAQEEEFYNAETAKIVTECAAKSDNGDILRKENGDVVIAENMQSVFYEKLGALNNTEVDAGSFSLTLDEASALGLSVRDLLNLDVFIREE